jgi:hypothetical protein
LYSRKTEFPSHEKDFTNNTSIWELLPRKFKIQFFNLQFQLLPSLTSKPQTSFTFFFSFTLVMHPVSLNVDFGINDPSISPQHEGLPFVVVMTHIEGIHFHLNQNQ